MTEISVTATGQARAAPDHAWVTLTSQAQAGTAREAWAAAQARALQVQGLLDRLQVAREDRGTQDSDVHRVTTWEDGAEHFVAWRATVSTECRVHEVEAASAVVEAVTALPDVAVTGPRWGVTPDHPAHSLARHSAVRQAQRLAADYADALGLDLGDVLRVSSGVPPAEGGGVGLRALAVEAPDPAQRVVTATVTLVLAARPRA